MKHLAIFQLDNFETAIGFDSKESLTEYVESCAKAAKTKALKSETGKSYIISLPNNRELNVAIQEVDTLIKYELIYDKNDDRIETSYYPTRTKLVSAAHKILDELDFEPSKEEDGLSAWKATNADSKEEIKLAGHLVLVGSEQNNVLESYNCVDMKYFCTHSEIELAKLDAKAKITKAASLKDGRKKGLINLGIGLAIAAVGALISFISYNNAKPGETYTVYTGIIVIGIIDAVCGLYYLINPKAALPKE